MTGDGEHDDDPADPTGNRARVLRFARRLLDRRELAEDTKELVSAVLSSSDKAKNEAIRLIARELRPFLRELVKDHSIEISVRLKPLKETEEPGDPEG
jgi:hypothetical protein